MCESLEDWINKIPGPAPIPQGKRQRVTIALAPEEAELIGDMLLHPAIRELMGGHIQDFGRTAFSRFIWEVDGLLKADFVPLITRIKDMARASGLQMTKAEIEKMLDAKGQELNLLVDLMLVGEAFSAYERMLSEIAHFPGVWPRAIHELMYKHHAGVKRFRDRVEDLGDAAKMRLRDIEEAEYA